jgi:hypothetical protein
MENFDSVLQWQFECVAVAVVVVAAVNAVHATVPGEPCHDQ